MNIHNTRVLIIGSGPAGCSASIYAARANLKPIMLCGVQPGGQLTITTEVENYPGFSDIIQGPWLMQQMEQQAVNVGTELIYDHVKSIDFNSYPYKAVGESNNEYIAESIIIATGAQAKWLGLTTEQKYQGFGVSGCATCDGFFYKNKTVIVVGGGNTAVEEALYLTNHAAKVIVIHRKNKFKAEKILQDRLFKNEKIEVIWNSRLIEVLGTEEPLSVTAAKIENIETNKVYNLAVDGIFIAIGHSPNTNLFKNALDIDEDGYIITVPNSTQTNLSGVFAAGDVQDKIYRQAITAAGTGCMAALEVEKFLSAKDDL